MGKKLVYAKSTWSMLDFMQKVPVRKGTKTKLTKVHKDKTKYNRKNNFKEQYGHDWRKDTVWAKKVADEFKS